MARRLIGRQVFVFTGGGILILGIIVYLGFYPVYILSIKDISNGKTVHAAPATPGDNLWITFINSVEKLPVADHFVVNDNYEILFTETIFQAPYAGYDRSDKAELIAPGTLKISGYNRQVDAYTFYAGDISRHMLFLNGNWLPLYEVAQGGDLIQMTVNKRSRLDSIVLNLKNWLFGPG
ncbi:hypothetical protein D1BOALGB6SA_4545 [Olavius sp. associated proteobacterium Delta 1]|nr:hypothetical protein D1BOALGB6SA_4545 [Olavius sp. associated proteobacterium Delta 1]